MGAMYGLRAERQAQARQRAEDGILKREGGKLWGPVPRESMQAFELLIPA